MERQLQFEAMRRHKEQEKQRKDEEKLARQEEREEKKEQSRVVKEAKAAYLREIKEKQQAYASAEGGVPDVVAVIFDSDIIITTDHKVMSGEQEVMACKTLTEAINWYLNNVELPSSKEHVPNYGKIKIYTKRAGFPASIKL